MSLEHSDEAIFAEYAVIKLLDSNLDLRIYTATNSSSGY
jgi:hypothetical protein